jgi:hypothetical protein
MSRESEQFSGFGRDISELEAFAAKIGFILDLSFSARMTGGSPDRLQPDPIRSNIIPLRDRPKAPPADEALPRAPAARRRAR